MDINHIVVAVAGAYLLAGFVKGVIGMGLPTVAVGMLGLIMTPAQAAAILIIPSLLTNIWQLTKGGGILALVKRLWTMLVGICAGTFLGAYYLPHSNSGQASMWLGVALCVYAVLGLVKIEFKVPAEWESRLGLIVGVVTGAVTVSTGVFALPGVPYMTGLQMERDKLVQTLGLSFTVSTIALALALQHAGEMNRSLLVPSLVALVMAFAGMWVGQIVRSKVHPVTFRRFFFLSLLLLGLHLTVRGLL